MERAKEDRKKSDNGEKAKNKPKVSFSMTEHACFCHAPCHTRSVAGTFNTQCAMYFQEARKWATGHSKNESLDYSEKSDGVRGASDGDSGAESINMQQKSLVDMDEDIDNEDSEEVGAHDHCKCLQVHPQKTDMLMNPGCLQFNATWATTLLASVKLMILVMAAIEQTYIQTTHALQCRRLH